MQDVIQKESSYSVVIEVTCHPWRIPFVWLFEQLFRAGDAIRIGRTTLYVKDKSGQVVHREYFGKSRKAAWYRQLDIEQKMRTMKEDDFLQWLKASAPPGRAWGN